MLASASHGIDTTIERQFIEVLFTTSLQFCLILPANDDYGKETGQQRSSRGIRCRHKVLVNGPQTEGKADDRQKRGQCNKCQSQSQSQSQSQTDRGVP